MAQSLEKRLQVLAPGKTPVVDICRNYNWLTRGDQVFPAMLRAIDSARESVCLETYIFAPGRLGERFLDSLVAARDRGVRVQVLIDALGSYNLPTSFWDPLTKAGGEVRLFNPISIHRLGLRNHRKLLLCDGRIGFIGGFNIAPEYEGDGVASGWCDLGLQVEGPLTKHLAESFERMFGRAEFRHKRFSRLRRSEVRAVWGSAQEQLLLSGPGRRNPIQRMLRRDLAKARSVQMVVAYFLPTWQVRRQLARVVRRGGHVDLILGGKSDVALSLLAGRSLYARLLKSGISIYEYQPQILHAKLLIIDNIVYVGSSNLDQRSLKINYELMIRFEHAEMARQARQVSEDIRRNCRHITLPEWSRQSSLWQRLKQHWAYLVLVRIDPYLALRQWKALPD